MRSAFSHKAMRWSLVFLSTLGSGLGSGVQSERSSRFLSKQRGGDGGESSSSGGASGGCDQGDPSQLEPFMQWLIKDYPDGISTWGQLCFDTVQGAGNAVAQSLFILGMKALSNFEYDYCKFSFDSAIKEMPDYVMAHWGRAMCESQLLWDSENPELSNTFLQAGRRAQLLAGVKLSDREEKYYRLAEALNNYSRDWPECEPGIAETRPCRFKAFALGCSDLFKDYPSDWNTGAYVVLSQLALGAVACNTTAPGQCQPAEDARTTALQLFQEEAYQTNPAFLHYALHSFDFPYAEIYNDGVQFAEVYPQRVNGSVHALHMASHIYQRAGNFSAAAAADHASVAAADKFAALGALAYQGGPVGTFAWNPGFSTSGFGFAYNAGNLYHSLEYEQYEVLQACDFEAAAALSKRMGIASMQALHAGGAGSAQTNSDNDEVVNLGKAWFQATTYLGWSYRMQARLLQQATFSTILAQAVVDTAEAPASLGIASTVMSTPGSPLPLAWQGSTDYTNPFNAPQSEAGLWNAIALAGTLGSQVLTARLSEGLAEINMEDNNFVMSSADSGLGAMPDIQESSYPFSAPCGGSAEGQVGTLDCTVLMALQRIREVQEFYVQQGIWYEANLTASLWYQAASSAALVQGNLTAALRLARRASDLEIEAVQVLLPTSTSIYFIPGTAFYGMLCLLLAQAAARGPAAAAEAFGATFLKEAEDAFAKCLSPQGRPNLTLCLWGAARTARLSNSSTKAGELYGKLLQNYGGEGSAAAERSCKESVREAARFATK